MQTKQLYLYNNYLKEFEGKIQTVAENQIILDQTVFHPLTGGVAYDTRYITKEKIKEESILPQNK